jgi:hypothetical protein
MWRASVIVGAMAIAGAMGSIGCRDASADEHARWVRVARDDAYDIYIDTAHIRRRLEGVRRGPIYPSFEVWYRTDHRAPRLYKGKNFNREVVRSIVQCDSLFYKVMSVDMSMGDERPISQQRLTADEVAYQVWRRIERGTSEEMAAQAACYFGARRQRRR